MKTDKRKLILDAALKLFVGQGFHATPTGKIAEEAGVANGTLFHYFTTKDELVVALYIDIKQRLYAYVAEHTSEQGTFKEVMKGHYLATLYWALDNKAEFRFMQQFSTSPYLAQISADVVKEQLQPHYAMLSKGIELKVLKPLPVDYLYTLITSQTYGLNDYLVANKFSKAKQHQVISDTFELLWGMIS